MSITSFFIGLIFGSIYSLLFVNKLKIFYQKKEYKNYIFRYIIFSGLSHIIFLTIFAFLIFKFRISVIITLLGFMIAFWSLILLNIRFFSRTKNEN